MLSEGKYFSFLLLCPDVSGMVSGAVCLFVFFQTVLFDSPVERTVGYSQLLGSLFTVPAVALQRLFYHLPPQIAQVQALRFTLISSASASSADVGV